MTLENFLFYLWSFLVIIFAIRNLIAIKIIVEWEKIVYLESKKAVEKIKKKYNFDEYSGTETLQKIKSIGKFEDNISLIPSLFFLVVNPMNWATIKPQDFPQYKKFMKKIEEIINN